MPEAGGSTTESGIFFQNTIAALYRGRQVELERPRHLLREHGKVSIAGLGRLSKTRLAVEHTH